MELKPEIQKLVELLVVEMENNNKILLDFMEKNLSSSLSVWNIFTKFKCHETKIKWAIGVVAMRQREIEKII